MDRDARLLVGRDDEAFRGIVGVTPDCGVVGAVALAVGDRRSLGARRNLRQRGAIRGGEEGGEWGEEQGAEHRAGLSGTVDQRATVLAVARGAFVAIDRS